MDIELLITNINFVISFIVSLSLGLLVYIRRPATGAETNKAFFHMVIAIAVWQLAYLLGINSHDPLISRYGFVIAVLASIFIILFNTYLILSITGRLSKHKKFIYTLFGIASGISVFHLLFPNTLLLPSEPYLYLPLFMVAGKFYYIQDMFFTFCFLYLLSQCFISYWKADFHLRTRLKYFLVGIIYAYTVGLVPALIIYGIELDPLLASLTGLYVIPFAYTILHYEIIEVNLLAKRAVGYSISVVGLTLVILFIGYTNKAIDIIIPGFPLWILPLISAIFAVLMGVFVWKKIKEADMLKFQFVDVVTHKFRTPLTHIKWSTEIIKSSTDPLERSQAIMNIEQANVRLVEMTNSLIGMSRTDENQYVYNYTSENLLSIINEVMNIVAGQAEAKKIYIEKHLPDDLPQVYADHKRLEFVIQMLIENALVYSSKGSRVIVKAENVGGYVHLSVTDSGIGISREDLNHLFSRFYRAGNALAVHTEGLGIGLSVSRDIMKRHGGDIWAESEGIGQGSVFTIKIPVKK